MNAHPRFKNVYIFRHGETDWNHAKRLQGHSDIPLNARGREQAARLALELKHVSIDLILTSDLSRALDTARFVARETGAPILVTPHLRETCLGAAEGLTHQEVMDRFGEGMWRRWLSLHPDDDEFAFPDGESKGRLRRRLFRAMETALRNYPHANVAVSTHGGALRRILHHVRPEMSEPAIVPNCQVFEFNFEPTTGLWRHESDNSSVARRINSG